MVVRNHPEWHVDTRWASSTNRNVSRLHGWGFKMAAVWHTLTWYPEHSATLRGYEVARHLGDLVTGDGKDVFL